MIFPLAGYETITPTVNLILALIIGIGFGFALERGGLGNAKKLIDQFLLKDLTVFKVMFTAIITAMTGLFILSSLNLVNLDLVQPSDSYLLPQFVGGLLLGVGFVVAGYCPGTTVVGMACGKIDALYSFIGLFVGAVIFSLIFDWLEGLYHATHLDNGQLTEILNLDYSTLVFIVISLALAGFMLAEKLESANE